MNQRMARKDLSPSSAVYVTAGASEGDLEIGVADHLIHRIKGRKVGTCWPNLDMPSAQSAYGAQLIASIAPTLGLHRQHPYNTGFMSAL
jgi:hypothetical protein